MIENGRIIVNRRRRLGEKGDSEKNGWKVELILIVVLNTCIHQTN